MRLSETLITKVAANDFNRIATLYEDFQMPQSVLSAKKLVEIAGLNPGQTVLDIGTGTGALALIAAKEVGKTGSVIGIDPAEKMLALARRKAIKLNLRNLVFRKMDATRLRFSDKSFDVVTANLAFPEHFFLKVATETFRVLKPEGELFFSEAIGSSAPGSAIMRIFRRYKSEHVSHELQIGRRAKLQMQEGDRRFPISKWPQYLRSVGFRNVHIVSKYLPFKSGKSDDYLHYFTAREQPEYDALTSNMKEAFRSECRKELNRILKARSGRTLRSLYRFYFAQKPKS